MSDDSNVPNYDLNTGSLSTQLTPVSTNARVFSMENSIDLTQNAVNDLSERIGGVSYSAREQGREIQERISLHTHPDLAEADHTHTPTYWQLKQSSHSSGSVRTITTSANIIFFHNLIQSKYYRVTWGCLVQQNTVSEGPTTFHDTHMVVEMRNYTSDYGSFGLIAVDETVADRASGVSGNVASEYFTATGSRIFQNANIDGKCTMNITNGTGQTTAYHYDKTYMILEELPNHELTSKWD